LNKNFRDLKKTCIPIILSTDYIGTILVIDDNQIIRKSVKYLLQEILKVKEKPYKIIEGSDGIDALKMVIDDQKFGNRIKCIFSDEKMEYFDGSKTISILRELESSKKIKRVNFVAVTSYEDNFSCNQILKSGADFVIQKPCSKGHLISILDNLKLI